MLLVSIFNCKARCCLVDKFCYVNILLTLKIRYKSTLFVVILRSVRSDAPGIYFAVLKFAIVCAPEVSITPSFKGKFKKLDRITIVTLLFTAQRFFLRF